MTVLKTPLDRAKKWVPLLCAYTGARPGEMTQLRKQDVQKKGDAYFAHLTPGAGAIKGGKARTVPLHEHLVELGFIEFVIGAGPGPMFYKPSMSLRPSTLSTRSAVPPLKRVSGWVNGYVKLVWATLKAQPTHAWRHTFLYGSAGRHRTRPQIRHHWPRDKSEGEAYGQAEPEELAEALKKFPRYDFDAVSRPKVGTQQ